jgi:tetratricopeptide (TPR) repeat protein
MKRWIGLALAAGTIAAAAIHMVAVQRTPEWTTGSPQALKAYEAGDAALRKVYNAEAREHFERAYALDPGFVVARWRIAQILPEEDPELSNRLIEELMSADLSDLTPRERCIIEYWRALRSRNFDEASSLLDDCMERLPKDAYILSRKAAEAWRNGNLDQAVRFYQDLIEVDPNWVSAYNSLGYIMKMRGRFTESEEYFRFYRYLAPEQANPHDSLGELFMTTGRYEEAESSFERAIVIKPDFWPSYRNLTILKAYQGEYDEIPTIIERARAAGIDDDLVMAMSCRARYAELSELGQWQHILDERGSDCVEGFNVGLSAIITHRAACLTGDWETAIALEDEASSILADAESRGDEELELAFRAALPHLRGVRLAIRGDLEGAEKHLRFADDRLGFIGADLGMYKLYNRLLLAEVMLAAGKSAEAHQLIADVRSVNSKMAEFVQESGFRILGLHRSERSARALESGKELPAL